MEVLAALRLDGRQIICAVEDPALCRSPLPTLDEHCAKEGGRRLDIDLWVAPAQRAWSQTWEIRPMPLGVPTRRHHCMKAESALIENSDAAEGRAHGPWSDLALHTTGWRAFQDLCSQVCEVVLSRPVEIFREAPRWQSGRSFPHSCRKQISIDWNGPVQTYF